MWHFIQALLASTIPLSHQQTLLNFKWKKAMDEKMEALLFNHTCFLLDHHLNVDIISSKCVFTIKYHSNETVKKFKVPLVVKGYTQMYEIDFFDTFSHVTRLGTIHLVIFVQVHYGWKLYQLDVKNTFLYRKLTKTVYMQQPLGYE